MTKIQFLDSLLVMKRRYPWIPVVTGLLKKNGQVLLGQRPEGNSLAGQWEFPGGKIELGESPENALKRELSEELGIEAEIGPLRLANTHSYGDRGVLLLFYDVPFWKGEPKPSHHANLRWVKPEELLELEIPEANRRILDVLLGLLK
jgi:8-oxo-dGTP diphosphatase